MVTWISNESHGCKRTLRCKPLVPADQSSTGRPCWAIVPIDYCLVAQVRTLNAEGRYTSACCCGHGYGPGSIMLHDGETIETRPCPSRRPALPRN